MNTSSKYSRRAILALLSGGAALAFLPASAPRTARAASTPAKAGTGHAPGAENPADWASLSEEQWRARLSEEEFAVLREEDTEPAFSSPLNEEKRAGTFACAGCAQPLFNSETKFDSGTGWPSFYDVLPGAVETKRDFVLIFPRTEYHCSRCGGHQGHIFDDGPEPTGKRYCNNGLALDFVPKTA